MQNIVKRDDLIFPELSYKITGILYNVFNELGSGLQEKYYQRAIAFALKKNNLKFQEQVFVPLKYQGEKIGNYYLDFLIEDEIIVEIKRGEFFRQAFIKQIHEYLMVSHLSLGLLANFTSSGVRVKRILNIYPK
ncbi:MAG: GxxExxY protein [Candidatus Parcubacteria bacterium]|nr:GxxExxY protein [Candidatus Parcubacteria bacterium]